MGQLRTIHSQLIDLGYQIIAVSPDRPAQVAQMVSKNDFEYTLLSDPAMAAARGFGVAFRMADDTVERYRKAGVVLEQHQLLPVPSVFLVDRKGKIRFTYVNPDYKVRIDPDTLLAAAKAAKK